MREAVIKNANLRNDPAPRCNRSGTALGVLVDWERFTPPDAKLIASRTGKFEPSIVRGVIRCSRGFPQVLLCDALIHMRPFPTSFWLACPYLTRMAGRLESRSGVSEMEGLLPDRGGAWLNYHMLHSLLRLCLLGRKRAGYLKRYRPGILRTLANGGAGGISYTADSFFVKCLHLQIASYIALGYHPASDWLDEKIGRFECGENECE
ncbi:hypothetical protein FACS1894216_10400 [Synergistales bacterium]|nr:hypothetical protein FACS1894216_10400 [Synergistales bacterium]